jgi:hypothetical protein
MGKAEQVLAPLLKNQGPSVERVPLQRTTHLERHVHFAPHTDGERAAAAAAAVVVVVGTGSRATIGTRT